MPLQSRSKLAPVYAIAKALPRSAETVLYLLALLRNSAMYLSNI
ncbi:MAG: hypothetical protein AAGA38_09900 [Pseudomonadota bacterium]